MWKVLQYEAVYDDLIGSVDDAAEARIYNAVVQLKEEGHTLRGKVSKPLGDGLFELRIRHKHMAFRLIYFFDGANIPIVVAFVKKTQKTPPRLMKLAKARKNEMILEGKKGVEITFH
ncbi:type II toxin-antitoxin system RelE/ParE family toxin [Pelagibius sp. Alg239-R121]|uniref:type II toxin-antitoxin system RelE/ParE family toxin n=1 Tax=Pelagibius sp. Alg239-R121 TaxID=2993448 RepID=UPI0024A77BAE|nr:type II toxin-antitoxin system RelE/ParE family toxin [Pelagibius sp. Alg239-R121]